LPGRKSIVFNDLRAIDGCKYFIPKDLGLNICIHWT
jgi:hypothetical protein